MKKVLILIVFGLLFAGCMSDNLVTNDPQAVNENNLEWITVPSNGLMSVETERTVSKVINGKEGGVIYLMERIGTIEVLGSLQVLKGSYNGNQNISVTLNDLHLYQDYYPSPFTFKVPLVLNLTYNNVDVSNVDPSTVGFYYMAENGAYYKASYDNLVVDAANKSLSIYGARLPHFSRWGWAKTDQ